MRFTAKIIAVLVAIYCSFNSCANVSVAVPFCVSAESAVLYEADNHNIIYSKNAEKRMGMASTTKIMTALVVLENSDVSEEVVISSDACGIEGSSIYLKEGEIISVMDLLYALLLQSANDAATALALHVGENLDNFADMMNERAATMSLKDTHFKNPSGLYDEDHYTTAIDLAKIMATALENETFAKIVSTKSITICSGKDNARTVVNHNRLLSSYDDSIGGKTGFTKATGRCLVHAASRDGLTLVSVTLNAPDDWNDHKKMLDLGFSSYENRLLAKNGDLSGTVSIMNGEKDTLLYKNDRDVCAVLPKDIYEIECEIELSPYLLAPIQKGDTVGGVYYRSNGKIIAYAPLIAYESIASFKK